MSFATHHFRHLSDSTTRIPLSDWNTLVDTARGVAGRLGPGVYSRAGLQAEIPQDDVLIRFAKVKALEAGEGESPGTTYLRKAKLMYWDGITDHEWEEPAVETLCQKLLCKPYDVVKDQLFLMRWMSAADVYLPLGPPPWYWAKLKTALAANGSVLADLWYWNKAVTPNAWADVGEDKTVWAPPLLSSGSLAAGAWVKIEWSVPDQRWEVTAAPC